MAPIMQLLGHQGDVLGGKFHPDGEILATAGMDRQVCKIILNFYKYFLLLYSFVLY